MKKFAATLLLALSASVANAIPAWDIEFVWSYYYHTEEHPTISNTDTLIKVTMTDGTTEQTFDVSYFGHGNRIHVNVLKDGYYTATIWRRWTYVDPVTLQQNYTAWVAGGTVDCGFIEDVTAEEDKLSLSLKPDYISMEAVTNHEIDAITYGIQGNLPYAEVLIEENAVGYFDPECRVGEFTNYGTTPGKFKIRNMPINVGYGNRTKQGTVHDTKVSGTYTHPGT